MGGPGCELQLLGVELWNACEEHRADKVGLAGHSDHGAHWLQSKVRQARKARQAHRRKAPLLLFQPRARCHPFVVSTALPAPPRRARAPYAPEHACRCASRAGGQRGALACSLPPSAGLPQAPARRITWPSQTTRRTLGRRGPAGAPVKLQTCGVSAAGYVHLLYCCRCRCSPLCMTAHSHAPLLPAAHVARSNICRNAHTAEGNARHSGKCSTPCTACCAACWRCTQIRPFLPPLGPVSCILRVPSFAGLHQRARSARLTQTEKAKPRFLQTCFQICAQLQLHRALLPWCFAAC